MSSGDSPPADAGKAMDYCRIHNDEQQPALAEAAPTKVGRRWTVFNGIGVEISLFA